MSSEQDLKTMPDSELNEEELQQVAGGSQCLCLENETEPAILATFSNDLRGGHIA